MVIGNGMLAKAFSEFKDNLEIVIFASGALYFWQALLMTPKLRSQKINNIIKSKPLKLIIFSVIFFKINIIQNNKKNELKKSSLMRYYK